MKQLKINPLGEQFDNLKHQHESAILGIWIFLATEVLFFSGLFLAYTVYRFAYPEAFIQASRNLNLLIGTINTAVLLTSSYTMALAVEAAQQGHQKRIQKYLLRTIILGSAFLALKAIEYSDEIEKGFIPRRSLEGVGQNTAESQLFIWLYYMMTGLHAFHMMIGLGVLLYIFHQSKYIRFSADYYSPVEVSGLYWHFVDIVWIFIYPLLYLIGLST